MATRQLNKQAAVFDIFTYWHGVKTFVLMKFLAKSLATKIGSEWTREERIIAFRSDTQLNVFIKSGEDLCLIERAQQNLSILPCFYQYLFSVFV